MKRNFYRSFSFLAILLASVFLFSCESNDGTVARVKILTPSEIDMSNYKNIAVTSTTPYTGSYFSTVRFSGDGERFSLLPYSYNTLPSSIASYFNTKFLTNLEKTGYFTKILKSPESDLLSNADSAENLGLSRRELLKRSGVDAIVRTAITNMDIDEYVESTPEYETYRYKDKKGNTRTETRIKNWTYTLYQTVKVTIELRIIDASSMQTIAIKSVNDSYKKSTVISYGTVRTSSTEPYFNSMIESLASILSNKMIPHYVYKNIQLFTNENPTVNGLDSAYNLADNGQYEAAYKLFLEAYKQTGQMASGANACIMLYAAGRVNDAYSLITSIEARGNYSSNASFAQLLVEIKNAYKTEQEAKKQLD